MSVFSDEDGIRPKEHTTTISKSVNIPVPALNNLQKELKKRFGNQHESDDDISEKSYEEEKKVQKPAGLARLQDKPTTVSEIKPEAVPRSFKQISTETPSQTTSVNGFKNNVINESEKTNSVLVKEQVRVEEKVMVHPEKKEIKKVKQKTGTNSVVRDIFTVNFCCCH